MRNTDVAATLFLDVTAQAQPDNAPPRTPSNPPARIYNGTYGGGAWQRFTDGRGIRNYEISRDGTVPGVGDTLSYIVDNLLPGSHYEIGIVATDTADQRLGRAVTVLWTLGGSSEPPAPEPYLASPASLRFVAYSSSAGATEWRRSATPGLRYEVTRDDTIVRNTNGIGYVDQKFRPGRRKEYAVVAIDPSGRRSAPSRVTLATPGVAVSPSTDNTHADPDPAGTTTRASRLPRRTGPRAGAGL